MCFVWSDLIQNNRRFVIRNKFNRKTKNIDDENGVRLWEELGKCKTIAEVRVTLQKKKSSPMPATRKAHPPREKREATLKMSAKQVELHKTNRHGHTIKETVLINVVRVVEAKKPDQDEPIEWLLLTTEPIQTAADVLRVVELYRCRWIIEEFFKGIKTGCQLESRLLTEASSWYKLFVLSLPIARNLLNLRLLGEKDIEKNDFLNPISPIQMKILQAKALEHNRELRTFEDMWLLIAKIGGYIPRKTPPGWITLYRGFKNLLGLEEGWKLAQSNM